MFSQNSIGIDFHKGIATLVHLRASVGGIRFVNSCFWRLNPLEGVEQQLKDTEKYISTYLADQKIVSPEIYLSIPAGAAMLRIIELPFAVRENLHGTLRYELEKYFPLSPEDVYLDAQIISENKGTNKIKILLMAVKKDGFNPFISFSRNLGAGICGIETSITAIANYLCYFSETAKKEPSIFICHQGDEIEIGLIKDGKLHHARVIAAGLNEATPVDIFQTELPMVASFLNPDEKHFNIYTDGFDEKEGFDKTKEEIDGFTITKLKFPINVQSERSLFSAYGLALKGFKKLPTKINLLPKAIRKRPDLGSYYVMVALFVLIVIAGLVCIGGYVLKKQATLSRLDDRIEALKKDNTIVTEMEDEIVVLEKRLKQLNSIQQEYVPILEILKELTHRMPSDSYIKEFLLSSAGFQIVGSAESATEIVTLLSESDLFKNVVFLSAITKEKDGNEQFRIGFTVGKGEEIRMIQMRINKERKLILFLGAILLLIGLVYRSSSIFDVLLDTSEFELKKKKLIKYQEHIPDKEILEKKRQVLRKRVEDYENSLLKGNTPALAAVSIQNRIGKIAIATGLEIKSTTVQKPVTIENTDLVSVDVQFTTELSIGQLKELLYQIEMSDRPLLQMKDIQLRRTSRSQEVKLQAVMTVRGFMAKQDNAG